MKNIKPILFNTEMVQAILDGRKTQTRRILKVKGCREFVPEPTWSFEDCEKWGAKPKYQPGDILWVRERFEYSDDLEEPYWYYAKYREDYLPEYVTRIKWRPSIHMPKEAARIFLMVTNVRCERLQDISEEDAIAEGAKDSLNRDDMKLLSNLDWVIKRPFGNHQFGFLALWQSINAKKHPWESNPPVWVYEFERIEKPAEL